MPSAKILAQKPAGNFSPLLFSGQDAAVDGAAAGTPCADAEEPIAHPVPSTSTMDHRLLYRRGNNMDSLRSLRMHDACANGNISPIKSMTKSNKGGREIDVAAITVEIWMSGVRFG